MNKQWGMKRREKTTYPLAGDLHTKMRYAVLGDKQRFLKRRHAYKAWRALREFGCTAYPVAAELSRLDGVKVYPDIVALSGKIDVVVPCLPVDHLSSLVEQCQLAGVQAIWFQEGNWNETLDAQCVQAGIKVVRGCVLKHKTYSKPLCFLHPCYWHGLYSAKVPKT